MLGNFLNQMHIIFYMVVLYTIVTNVSSSLKVNPCKSLIYCDGDLLHAIQMSNMFNDSKAFVDMPTKHSELQVISNFRRLGVNYTKEDLIAFVDENFYPVGYDVIIVEPSDWKETPMFVNKIVDKDLKHFANVLNSKWKFLTRQFDPSRICDECSSSAIYTKRPFIVPGGRFIEYYYWDSYWSVDGLLTSDMIVSARNVIENLIDMVKEYGFVPNGPRVYYLNRSQPPLLTQAVDIYFNKTKDIGFLKYALPYLDIEYDWWMRERLTNYTTDDGVMHHFNWYNVPTDLPRPESYKEDLINARESGNENLYYSNIISAAESGWDFSSRWFNDPFDIKTIELIDIIPVDLNAIMLKNEKILARLHGLFDKTENILKSFKYKRASYKREEAIKKVLWIDEKSTWTDFNIKMNRHHSDYQYPSDLTPLWAGVQLPTNETLNQILDNYEALFFAHISGVPSSNVHTEQQWDLPNAWAPYHDWLVQIFMRDEKTMKFAYDIAQRFVNSVFCGWQKSHTIYEKYNSDKMGTYGGGGEYIIQEGFGWTNAVVIKFLDTFGGRLKSPTTKQCEQSLKWYSCLNSSSY